MKYVLIGLLKVYRLVISPLYGDVCRYYPSCSAYALGAVRHHGALRGSWYAVRRLLRCHPWAPGGYDPVPGTDEPVDERTHEQSVEDQGAVRVHETGQDHPAGSRMDRTGSTEDPAAESEEISAMGGAGLNGHRQWNRSVAARRTPDGSTAVTDTVQRAYVTEKVG